MEISFDDAVVDRDHSLLRLAALQHWTRTKVNDVGLPEIKITPGQFQPNLSVTLTVTPADGMDFSGVQSTGVAMIPPAGIAQLQAIPQSNGDLRVDFTTAGAQFGTRTLVIIGPDHLVMASGVVRVVP